VDDSIELLAGSRADSQSEVAMAVPLSRILFDASNTPEARRYRAIESHYHMEMVAGKNELVNLHAASLCLQAKTAGLTLRAMGEIADREDVTNDHLAALVEGMDSLGSGMERMGEGLDDLKATVSATLDALQDQTEALREGLGLMADRMLAQHRALLDIAWTLRRPYETRMLELREQADKWLTNGMSNTGRERDDDYNDAMQLLQEVIKNPIGNQDYVTWFQIGWLLWQHSAKLPEAEQAFYRASRLSAPHTNQYHGLSVRHFAYMQDLQGRHEEAFQTMQKIVDVASDPDALYDTARYAAKTGRKREALTLLEQCIKLVPTTIITMFAEEDFKA
jgi:tetratricopeptide (TPR) repeat protein